MMLRGTVVVLLILGLASIALGQTTQAGSDPSEFASFGVKLEVPASWQRVLEDGPNIIARWAVPDADGKYSIIVVADLQAAKGTTLQMYATSLATQVHGQAEPQKQDLGYESAWQIDYPVNRSAAGFAPVQTLVAFRGDFFYRITAFAESPDADPKGAVEQLRRGWQFCPMTRPSECVSLRRNPINCWNLMTFKPPATFRLRAPMPKDPGSPMEFRIFNYRSGLSDVLANVGVQGRPPHQTIEQIEQSLVDQTGFQEDPRNRVRWEPLKGAEVTGVISSAFDAARSGDRRVPLRLALVDLDERAVAVCIFVFPTEDKDDQEIYRHLVETSCKTIRPIKP